MIGQDARTYSNWMKRLRLDRFLMVVLLTVGISCANVPTKSIESTRSIVGQPSEAGISLVEDSPLQNESVALSVSVVPLIALEWREREAEELGFVYYRWGLTEDGKILNSKDFYDEVDRANKRIDITWLGTGRVNDAIVYIKDVGRTTGPSSFENPLVFSPDGEQWFRTESLPDVPGISNIRGAVWDGDDILIIANYQYKPWQYKVYLARVTPRDLEIAYSSRSSIPETILDWAHIPEGRVPFERFRFVSGTEAREWLNFFSDQANGSGDGTGYSLIDTSDTGEIRKRNPNLYFTGDRGRTWIRVANPYPGHSETTPGADGLAAIVEGDTLVLYLSLEPTIYSTPQPGPGLDGGMRQPSPNYSWWYAKIPLDQLEGVSP